MDIEKKFEAARKSLEERLKRESKTKSIEEIDTDALNIVRENMLRDIGNRLLSIRKKYNLDEKEMLKRYYECSGKHYSASAWSRWENGERQIDLLVMLWLVEEFDVDLHVLLTGERRTPRNQLVQQVIDLLESALRLLENL